MKYITITQDNRIPDKPVWRLRLRCRELGIDRSLTTHESYEEAFEAARIESDKFVWENAEAIESTRTKKVNIKRDDRAQKEKSAEKPRNCNHAGTTHFEGCWRDHLECAVAKAEEAEQTIANMEYYVTKRNEEIRNLKEALEYYQRNDIVDD